MRLVVFLLACLPSLAEIQPSIVEGRVFNLGTGEPIRKAQVLLRPEGSNSRQPHGALTDAAGGFSITGVPPGRYVLMVERAGFVGSVYGGSSRNRRGVVTISPGQHLKDLVFRLTPHGVVTGRVLDEEGEPVNGATVHALRYGYAQGRRSLMPVASSTSNDIGEYRLAGLAPGRYFLSATYRATAIFNRASEESYAPTYFPGTADPGAAAPIQVIQGNQMRGIDIQLTRTGTVRVSGRVTNSAATGEGRRNVMVFLVPRDGGFRGVGNRNSSVMREGKFEISGVIPGSYMISAHWYEDGARYTASQPLDIGSGGVENVSLTLAQGFEVKGRVRIEGSSEARLGATTVMLRAAYDDMAGAAGGRTQPDGSFALQNVAPGDYRLQLFGMPEGCYLKSARLGDADLLENGASVSPGSGPLEIVLSASGGQVEGVALDAGGQPVPNTTVVLYPGERRRHRADLFLTASPDQNGRFLIKGIAPGEYRLLALQDAEPGAWQDPDFLKQHEKHGESVSIKENGRETAQLKVAAVEQP